MSEQNPTVQFSDAFDASLSIAAGDFGKRSVVLMNDAADFLQVEGGGVHNEKSSNVAWNLLDDAKALERGIKAYFKDPKRDAHRVHKEICRRESDELEVPTVIKKQIGAELDRWDAEVLEVQCQRAEEERLRMEKIAILGQQWRVEALAEAGRTDEAIAAAHEPLDVPDVLVPTAPEAPDGHSNVTTYVVVVEDFWKVPRMYMIPDLKALNKYASATLGKLPIPGCRIDTKTFRRTLAKRS